MLYMEVGVATLESEARDVAALHICYTRYVAKLVSVGIC